MIVSRKAYCQFSPKSIIENEAIRDCRTSSLQATTTQTSQVYQKIMSWSIAEGKVTLSINSKNILQAQLLKNGVDSKGLCCVNSCG